MKICPFLKSRCISESIGELKNWLTVLTVLIFSSLFQYSIAQVEPNTQIKQRQLKNEPIKKFVPLYSAPDQLIIPAGMTKTNVLESIYRSARTSSSGFSTLSANVSSNPDIPASLLCADLKVIFVLDESGSISSAEANLVRQGALSLANALNNSGAELRVVEFNTTSSIINLGSPLVNSSFLTTFSNYLNASSGASYRPVSSGTCVGWTNWEDALDDVQTLDGDLVIFFTDGNPTAYNVARANGCANGTVTVGTNSSYNATVALDRAIAEANIIKGQGKHMFVAAVGSDLNLDNCIDISGSDNFATTGSIFTADYTVGGFESLATNLAAAANSICGTELTINKTASATGVCSGETVQFTIQVTNTGGDYNFTAFNVQIEDVFPNGFSNIAFVGAAPSGASISGNTLTYNLTSLAANASVSVTVSATVDVPPGNFNNIATAIADNANEVSDNASVVSGFATETLTISECSPITVNGVVYSSTGLYTQQLVSSVGCDSILTIDFTLKSATNSSTNVTACGSYSWNGENYSESGAYTFNTTNAAGCDSIATLNLTITQVPQQPTTACYQVATFNQQTCSWSVSGDMPVAPTGLACYQSASFNTESCEWEVTGTMPAQPATACYQSASFNTESCEWEVTGTMPVQPTTACYQSATFNTESCEWEVTGTMPAQPATACYQSASFNTESCEWEVTGTMPVQPATACYQSASFNTESCEWDVTGTMPAQPATACYQSASFNTESCEWEVTGTMPVQPAAACYQSASFNTESCEWDVTGTMPAQPATACYQSASFNTESCEWEVTGTQNPTIVTTADACGSYVWSVNGVSYNQSGTYNFSENCQDYLLNLTININSTFSFSVTLNEGGTYNFNGTSISAAGTYTSTIDNAAGCDSIITLLVNVNVIESGCYGVEVYNFDQRLTKLGTAVNPERSFPANALGAPNGQNPAVNAPIQNFFSLGFGGSIEIRFADPIANGAGADLKIWESSASANAEKAQVLVSQDGLGYIPVGTVSMGGEVDFGAVFSDYIQYVKILDISNPAQFSNSQVADGYDVDAIECLHGRYIAPNCNAISVVSSSQGKCANGADVLESRSNTDKVLGTPEVTVNGVVDFFALGFGGQITVDFGGPVANGDGDDILVTETTWGYTCANYPETADVFASQDGVNFVFLGRTCLTKSFDLGTLSWARYIKVVDASDASLFPGNADGYDVNGIECLHPGVTVVPVPEDLTPCVATSVVKYEPKKTKNGNNIQEIRSHASNALGAPQGNDTHNFVSLGFGGSLTIKYDFVIFNLAGDDIRVIETSFGNPNCPNYPEHATVSVSMDGVNFTNLDEICLDGTVDLGSVPYAQYVKITDISNAANFGGSADGFDVDAVVVLNGPCSVAGAKMAEFDNTTTADESLEMSLYPNPAIDFSVVSLEGTMHGEMFTIEVVDAAGRLIRKDAFTANGATAQYFLKVNDLANGVYTVRVSNANEQFVQRLVK